MFLCFLYGSPHQLWVCTSLIVVSDYSSQLVVTNHVHNDICNNVKHVLDMHPHTCSTPTSRILIPQQQCISPLLCLDSCNEYADSYHLMSMYMDTSMIYMHLYILHLQSPQTLHTICCHAVWYTETQKHTALHAQLKCMHAYVHLHVYVHTHTHTHLQYAYQQGSHSLIVAH